ncbi:Uncharacterised protein [Mycobacteroides abscessus subsp. abscessus]|nr:Uncharacterised protein [Mycobacteroides abscessus subsp. abscessus]
MSGRCSRRQYDDRRDFFAVVAVGYADDCGFDHIGMLIEDFLHLAGIDVVTTTDDQILDAVDDPQIAVDIDLAEIACAEPTVVRQCRGGRLLIAPVTLEHHVARDEHLTDDARCAHGPVGVAYLDAHPRNHGAGAAYLSAAVDVVERRHRGGLGQPVTLEQGAPEALLEGACDLPGKRRSAGDGNAQMCKPFGVRFRCLVQHRVPHGRDAAQHCQPIAGEHVDHSARCETTQQRHRCARGEGRHHHRRLTEDVEQRQSGAQPVVCGTPADLACHLSGRQEVLDGQFGAFGLPGGARGVEQGGGLVGCTVDGGLERCRGHVAGTQRRGIELPRGNTGPGCRVGDCWAERDVPDGQ